MIHTRKSERQPPFFEKDFGSVVCLEILCGAKPQPFKCGKKVRIAAEIADKILDK
ncbi:MAG: C-GCAxxG-C-C family protein [Eubacterium sp.]|nr:C-GCAxxG-C-C family protein [Eubacterium sp.]